MIMPFDLFLTEGLGKAAPADEGGQAMIGLNL